MATTVDTLVTEYKMNATDYNRGAAGVVADSGRMASAVGIAGQIITAFVAAVGAASAALITLGIASSKKAAEFDAMVKALEAVVGGADKAKKALKELSEIAAMPGLGLEEALKGYTALRRSGLDDSMAMRTISSAGNANALASGGRAELEQILRAISQIAMKPNLSGEELMQLNDAGVPASKIIGDKFGTFDGGELKKLGVDSKAALEALVEGLEKMPKAGESAKNSMENLQMAIDMAMVGIGTGLNGSFMPIVDNITTAFDNLQTSDFFGTLGSSLATLAESTFPELSGSATELEDVLVSIAATILDVADAILQLRYVAEGLIKLAEATPGYRIQKFIMDKLGGNDGVKSSGDNFRDEHDLRVQLRDARARQEERNKKKASAGTETVDEDQAARDEAIKKGKELMERSVDYHRTQVDLQKRMVSALETMASSTIGGTSYGDAALAPINLSGGPMRTIVRNEVLSMIGGLAVQAQTRAFRRR
jgi:tape measure domain-containing protein